MMQYGLGFGSIFGGINMLLGMIFQIVFRGIIIWIIVIVIQNSGKLFKNNEENEALQILKRKYANGDISKKEYFEKKKDLIE